MLVWLCKSRDTALRDELPALRAAVHIRGLQSLWQCSNHLHHVACWHTNTILHRFLLKFTLLLTPNAVKTTGRRLDGLKLDYGRAFDAAVLETGR